MKSIQHVKDLVSRLGQIDLSPVDRRVMKKFNNKDFVEGLRNETLRFLGIAAYSKESVAPSKIIDEYWHELILNTSIYDSMSKTIGEFIHHVPSDKPEIDSYKTTMRYYATIFGNPDTAYWMNAAESCSTCNAGRCNGSCNSYCSDDSCRAYCRN